MDEDFIENDILEPVEFQLANGTNIRLAFAHFWEKLTVTERQQGVVARKYFAIRIYSNENQLSNHLSLQSELRAEHEFRVSSLTSTWAWLEEIVPSRRHMNYEDLDDFVEDLTIELEGRFQEDAVEHIEHLPEISDPEAFDKYDDSLSNDQNEPN
jgi:hypothetical protein